MCWAQPGSISPPCAAQGTRGQKGLCSGQGCGRDGDRDGGRACPHGRAGGQRSWEGLREGAGWIQSLSFTWAGVQPQNSRPKTRSHERKKIARRRIIHPYLPVLRGCGAAAAAPAPGPLRSGRDPVPSWCLSGASPVPSRCQRALPGSGAPRELQGPGCAPARLGRWSEGQGEPSTSLPTPLPPSPALRTSSLLR